MTTLLAILILLNVATLLVGWRLFRRTSSTEEADTRDALERSRWLLEMEARERWAALDLDRLHPVNREEVEVLLAKVEASSPQALTGQERALLERMVEAERRATRRRRDRPGGPGTRGRLPGPGAPGRMAHGGGSPL